MTVDFVNRTHRSCSRRTRSKDADHRSLRIRLTSSNLNGRIARLNGVLAIAQFGYSSRRKQSCEPKRNNATGDHGETTFAYCIAWREDCRGAHLATSAPRRSRTKCGKSKPSPAWQTGRAASAQRSSDIFGGITNGPVAQPRNLAPEWVFADRRIVQKKPRAAMHVAAA